ncbi:MAG: xanthan lyase [Bacteroidaceae bacterium]
MKRCYLLLAYLVILSGNVFSQDLERNVKDRLDEYFSNYTTSSSSIGKVKLKSFEINHNRKELAIHTGESFAYQPFLPETVEGIYRQLSKILPGPVNYYTTTVYVNGKPIEELIPNFFRDKKKDKERLSLNIDYKGEPWVKNTSVPYTINRGLQNRHIALWQSHGKYFKSTSNEWAWQRPRLYCTTEDMFTQSFVLPYVLPMLENAGAIVFTPRERDTQRNEVIVDNDTPRSGSIYIEGKSRKSRWNTPDIAGFAKKKERYYDNENPFTSGTARYTKTEKKKYKAFAEWIPTLPETGKYAVYISYKTLPQSISDAKYTVFHNGGATEFKVNQQIGGGTWVYLGTFEFDKGNNDYGMVVLSNESSQKGVVCADAVRFGGGMGNIARGATRQQSSTSGLPRYLEAARYSAQWAGMPYNIYSGKEGTNDYTDDINVRSRMTNYLSGNSVYNPTEQGLGIPFEMSMGIHSDAGFTKNNDIVGSLGIYTSEFNEGKLNSGISRYASRDLADIMLTGLKKDIPSLFNVQWNRRGMWDKNYSETRLPAVPSMILELLSHQNFADMKLGHDPNFKFAVGRSIYKSILRFVASQHDASYTVQPLPISHFAIKMGKKKNTVQLSWQAKEDPLEPSAKPKEYMVYTRIGYGGFDNGQLVSGSSCTIKIEQGLVYSFKVTAVNRGGESFPSEILSAYKAKRSKGTILIINGFDRISAPATINTSEAIGFDLEADPGVPYLSDISLCGAQTGFDPHNIGKETKGGLGYSDSSLEGLCIAGNSFDYPFVHGKAIQAVGHYSFVSCSNEAVESGQVKLADYPIVDFILGLEKSDPEVETINNRDYKTFTPEMQQLISVYCRQGGNLFVSGSYLGSDMNHSPAEREFTKQILKYQFGSAMKDSYSAKIFGAGRHFEIPRALNEKQYAVTAPECILPIAPAFSAFVYTGENRSAGIVYKGDYRTFVLGFPFESITSETERAQVMASVLQFFKP